MATQPSPHRCLWTSERCRVARSIDLNLDVNLNLAQYHDSFALKFARYKNS